MTSSRSHWYTFPSVITTGLLRQGALGTALWTLGDRVDSVQHLEEALCAFQRVLDVEPEKNDPVGNRATAQGNIGVTFSSLGRIQKDPSLVEKAIEAYEGALRARPRNSSPLEWASTQLNIGNAMVTLMKLSGNSDGNEPLEQAISKFNEALSVFTPEKVPLAWAMAKNGLGSTLLGLHLRTGRPNQLSRAIHCLESALTVRTFELDQRGFASTQHCLALAFKRAWSTASEKQKVREYADRALKASESALRVYTPQSDPEPYAGLQEDRANLLMYLGREERNLRRWDAAVEAYDAAMDVYGSENERGRKIGKKRNELYVFIDVNQARPIWLSPKRCK